jgi:hypothetical protein
MRTAAAVAAANSQSAPPPAPQYGSYYGTAPPPPGAGYNFQHSMLQTPSVPSRGIAMASPATAPAGRIMMNMVRAVRCMEIEPDDRLFSQINRPDWIVDTGAGMSMTSDLSKFVSGTYVPRALGETVIIAAGGHLIPVLGEGTVAETIVVHEDSMEMRHNIELHNVLYAPELKVNLLSLTSLNNDGFAANFPPSGAFIYRPGVESFVPLSKAENLFILPSCDFDPAVPRLDKAHFAGVSAYPIEQPETGLSEWKRESEEINT